MFFFRKRIYLFLSSTSFRFLTDFIRYLSSTEKNHVDNLRRQTTQVLSSSWDGRPFGHNRHGQPKIEGCAVLGGGPA